MSMLFKLGGYPQSLLDAYEARRKLFGCTFFYFCLFLGFATAIHVSNLSGGWTSALINALAIFTLVIAVIHEIFQIVATVRANKRFANFANNGMQCDGHIVSIQVEEQRFAYRGRFQCNAEYAIYNLIFVYQFTTPDGFLLTGSQSATYEDLRDRPLPTVGTPIRVLYADENTHLML